MAQILPQPGQVIRYAYLWWSEARVGREDGAGFAPGATYFDDDLASLTLSRIPLSAREADLSTEDVWAMICA